MGSPAVVGIGVSSLSLSLPLCVCPTPALALYCTGVDSRSTLPRAVLGGTFMGLLPPMVFVAGVRASPVLLPPIDCLGGAIAPGLFRDGVFWSEEGPPERRTCFV